MHDQTQTIDKHPSRQLRANNTEAEDHEDWRPPYCHHVINICRLIWVNLPENLCSELGTIFHFEILRVFEVFGAPKCYR